MSDPHVSEFEQRLREFHHVVYQVVFAILRAPADAEETTQDALEISAAGPTSAARASRDAC